MSDRPGASVVKRGDVKLRVPLPKELLELQERLNIQGQGPYVQPNPNAPPIEIPPLFRKPTKIIGTGPSEARTIEKMFDFLPQLRGRIPSITSGYGPMYINKLSEQATGDNYIDRSWANDFLNRIRPLTIMGLTGKNKNIELNTTTPDFEDTLFHEMVHAAQPKHENALGWLIREMEAQEAEKIYNKHKSALRMK